MDHSLYIIRLAATPYAALDYWHEAPEHAIYTNGSLYAVGDLAKLERLYSQWRIISPEELETALVEA